MPVAVVEISEVVGTATSVAGPSLEVRGLGLEIGGRPILNGIDLVSDGRGLMAVMGYNGAGKSLFLRLLHGLARPTRGAVLWGGEPMGDRVRRRQAMVFQKPAILRRSVAANLEFALAARGRSASGLIEALLADAGLLDLAHLPARSLSGGEQQRLALARALAQEPDVLFLDEPTASLDPASTAAIEEVLGRARASGTKIVLVTHDPGQARRLADEVVFLHRGELVEQGPATEALSSPRSESARAYLEGRLV